MNQSYSFPIPSNQNAHRSTLKMHIRFALKMRMGLNRLKCASFDAHCLPAISCVSSAHFLASKMSIIIIKLRTCHGNLHRGELRLYEFQTRNKLKLYYRSKFVNYNFELSGDWLSPIPSLRGINHNFDELWSPNPKCSILRI